MDSAVILRSGKILPAVPLLLIILFSGCAADKCDVRGRPFEIKSLAKTDIDLVSELHQRVVFDALRELAVKLYKRNPREWRKEGNRSLEEAVEVITANPFPAVNGKTSIDCIRLAFDEEFAGDRVKAFVAGLETMVLSSYDGKRSFYVYNLLDAQKLYNSARNIELASWLIRTKHDRKNVLFLVSTGEGGDVNLSFERLFGKMINAQDMLAQIMADRTHREIKTVIQTLMTVFIPI
ncbi:MAG TPA: hypothetical protein VF799_04700 [Geobacteraceae bacterium]